MTITGVWRAARRATTHPSKPGRAKTSNWRRRAGSRSSTQIERRQRLSFLAQTLRCLGELIFVGRQETSRIRYLFSYPCTNFEHISLRHRYGPKQGSLTTRCGLNHAAFCRVKGGVLMVDGLTPKLRLANAGLSGNIPVSAAAVGESRRSSPETLSPQSPRKRGNQGGPEHSTPGAAKFGSWVPRGYKIAFQQSRWLTIPVPRFPIPHSPDTRGSGESCRRRYAG